MTISLIQICKEAIIIPDFPMGKLRLREVRWLTYGLRVSWNLNPCQSDSFVHHTISTIERSQILTVWEKWKDSNSC